MGLDMYLEAEVSTWNRSEGEKERIRDRLLYAFPNLPIYDNLGTVKLTFEVGYWRKANAIHKWFVDNVQEGVDECQRVYVSRDKLRELKGKCADVLEDRSLAETLLPTQSGFFFGGTDYNNYYFKKLRKTVDIIDTCLELDDAWDIYYMSSW